MASQVFIGFGATSHNDGVLTTARFSNVSVSGSGARVAAAANAVIEPANPEIIKLYPNPAGNIVHIQWQGAAEQFIVYDVAGHAVLTGSLKTNQQSAEINMAALPKGVYIMNVKLAGGLHTVSFLKE
jgi:hypothetical protein